AEDGIRDRNVTGVQTCALPISAGARIIISAGDYRYRGVGTCIIASVLPTDLAGGTGHDRLKTLHHTVSLDLFLLGVIDRPSQPCRDYKEDDRCPTCGT